MTRDPLLAISPTACVRKPGPGFEVHDTFSELEGPVLPESLRTGLSLLVSMLTSFFMLSQLRRKKSHLGS